MKEYLYELVRSAQDPLAGSHLAREYLQARILESLQRAGAFVALAFHGGTALRFLFGIPRFSEDLDFALELRPEDYDFQGYVQRVQTDLRAENYPVQIRANEEKVVHSAWVRFQGLPYELGLSPHEDQVLMIRFEVDTHPPAGARLATTVVRRHVVLHLQHHDRATLLAGKLHAILQRTYTKGRDLFDLFWYLSNPDWPIPNFEMLNHALVQTGWEEGELSASNWRQITWERLSKIDWGKAVADVRPFLMDRESESILTRENLRQMLLAV